jgi:hypothetical protein
MTPTTTPERELVDSELSLDELASLQGAAPAVPPMPLVPVIPAVVGGIVLFFVYKGAKHVVKKLNTVTDNLDSCSSCSDSPNKMSYHDGLSKEEDPFNGAITGK